MPRGRKRLPDDIKALKGNPGGHRLALENVGKVERILKPVEIAMPDFLKHEREQKIFRWVVNDYLQRRLARSGDVNAFARWARYLHLWIECSEQMQGTSTWLQVDNKKYGVIHKRHPLFKDMLDLEGVLQSLEDRLGLNPVARQNIIRGLSTMPPALGGLFGEETKASEDGKEVEAEVLPPSSPLAWLLTTGKTN